MLAMFIAVNTITLSVERVVPWFGGLYASASGLSSRSSCCCSTPALPACHDFHSLMTMFIGVNAFTMSAELVVPSTLSCMRCVYMQHFSPTVAAMFSAVNTITLSVERGVLWFGGLYASHDDSETLMATCARLDAERMSCLVFSYACRASFKALTAYELRLFQTL